MTNRFNAGDCATCGYHPSSPYRRLVDGTIVEGCISRAHDGKLYGESLAWHMRPAAVNFRKDMDKRYKKAYGYVSSGIIGGTANVAD